MHFKSLNIERQSSSFLLSLKHVQKPLSQRQLPKESQWLTGIHTDTGKHTDYITPLVQSAWCDHIAPWKGTFRCTTLTVLWKRGKYI